MHEIFVNTVVDDGSDIADLMSCFTKKKVKSPKFPLFSNRVEMLKTTEEGLDSMCEVMEKYEDVARIEGRNEGREEGRKEGRVEGRKEGKAEGIIESGKLMSLTEDQIIDNLITICKITKEAAVKLLDPKAI